jgi:hypothetical protein
MRTVSERVAAVAIDAEHGTYLSAGGFSDVLHLVAVHAHQSWDLRQHGQPRDKECRRGVGHLQLAALRAKCNKIASFQRALVNAHVPKRRSLQNINLAVDKCITHVSCPNGPCSNLNARAIKGAFDAQLTTCQKLNGKHVSESAIHCSPLLLRLPRCLKPHLISQMATADKQILHQAAPAHPCSCNCKSTASQRITRAVVSKHSRAAHQHRHKRRLNRCAPNGRLELQVSRVALRQENVALR